MKAKTAERRAFGDLKLLLGAQNDIKYRGNGAEISQVDKERRNETSFTVVDGILPVKVRRDP
jgi:hypothetical protein